MSAITPERIAELERLEAAATAAPWKIRYNAILAEGSVDTCPSAVVWSTIFHADPVEAQDSDGRTWYTSGTSEDNATFIAAARNEMRPLLAALREAETQRDAAIARADKAEREVAELRNLLKPYAADSDAWADSVPDDYHPKCCEPGNTYAHPGSETKFSVGDLRRAAKAVAPNGEGRS